MPSTLPQMHLKLSQTFVLILAVLKLAKSQNKAPSILLSIETMRLCFLLFVCFWTYESILVPEIQWFWFTVNCLILMIIYKEVRNQQVEACWHIIRSLTNSSCVAYCVKVGSVSEWNIEEFIEFILSCSYPSVLIHVEHWEYMTDKSIILIHYLQKCINMNMEIRW